ncbi:receptor binding protein 4 [Campylobacter phage F372]|uniref:Receptor binding protein 4 n=1 Tax=Campylobacter phage F372 TaxID=2794375 RepID=A0A7T3KHK4_9CAUD|nr:receptor binding protein 4 [Campylobacter phage F372]
MKTYGQTTFKDIIDNTPEFAYNLEFTIGNGGNFTNIQDALNYCKRYINYPKYVITLKLLNNLTINYTINIANTDFRNLIIDGNGFTISKNCSSQHDVVFYGDMSIYPLIKNLTVENTNNRSFGIAFTNYHGSIFASHATVENSLTIKNFYNGIRHACSYLFTPGLTLDNCEYGLYAFRKSDTCLDAYVNIKNCGTGITVYNGSEVVAQGVTFAGNTTDCNISYNTPTTNGTIWKKL